MPADAFSYDGRADIRAPATHAASITPSDTTDLPTAAMKGIYVGGAGNITLDTTGGEATVLFTAPPVGSILLVSAKRVRATGTSATLLIALY